MSDQHCFDFRLILESPAYIINVSRLTKFKAEWDYLGAKLPGNVGKAVTKNTNRY
ncbi:hypothetical protein ES703_59264 [subsurface metagenome]